MQTLCQGTASVLLFAKDGKRMEVTPEIRNAVRNLEKGA